MAQHSYNCVEAIEIILKFIYKIIYGNQMPALCQTVVNAFILKIYDTKRRGLVRIPQG